MPVISLIVPIYNVESYLVQCLDSLRAQTLQDIEILCVIDGATDRSALIAHLYESLDKRIRVIEKENGGLSSARNAGIEAAMGDVIMFVDADDMLLDKACEKVRDAFEAHDAEMLTFGAYCLPEKASTPWYDRTLSPRENYYSSFDCDILFKEASRPFVWRTACKRSFFKRAGLRFDEGVRFGEDQIFHFAAYPKAYGVMFIPDKLYLYRLTRFGSLMAMRGQDPKLRLSEHIVIVEHICEEWQSDHLMDDYAPQLLTWTLDFLLFDLMRAPDDCRIQLFEQAMAVFSRFFDQSVVEKGQFSPVFQDICQALISNNRPEELEALRSSYFADIDYRESGDRPAWKSKLRHVFPMSALALEERLSSALSFEEQTQWEIADAAEGTRSLELLRLELQAAQHSSSKGVSDKKA